MDWCHQVCPLLGLASVYPGFTLGVSIPARPQPRASRGQNKASLFCTHIDLLLEISAIRPCPRCYPAFSSSIPLPPSFPLCRPSKGQPRLLRLPPGPRGPLWCPPCCVFCYSVKHLPGKDTGTHSTANAHTFSTQGAGVEVSRGVRAGGWAWATL